MYGHIHYTVHMDKRIELRVDDDFLEKVEYIQYINDYKSKSDAIRRTMEKEYRKEKRYLKVWDETWVKLMKEEEKP